VFGFTHDDLHNNIEKARSIYGEGNKFGVSFCCLKTKFRKFLQGTNVIFTHGTFDMYDAATFHGDSNGEDRVQLLIPSKSGFITESNIFIYLTHKNESFPDGGQSNDLLASVKTQEADFVRQQIITYFVRWLQN
jgi:hypothetical protein